MSSMNYICESQHVYIIIENSINKIHLTYN